MTLLAYRQQQLTQNRSTASPKASSSRSSFVLFQRQHCFKLPCPSLYFHFTSGKPSANDFNRRRLARIFLTLPRTRQARRRKRFHVPPHRRRLGNMAYSRPPRPFLPSIEDLQYADKDRKGSNSNVVAESSDGIREFGRGDDRGRLVEADWRSSWQWTGGKKGMKGKERDGIRKR